MKSTWRLTEPSGGTSAEVGPKIAFRFGKSSEIGLKRYQYEMFKSLWSGLGVIKPKISENFRYFRNCSLTGFEQNVGSSLALLIKT